MADVALVCGNATLDRLGAALVPGGSAYYAAHALAALGARVRVLTSVGSDHPADAFRPAPDLVGVADPLGDPAARLGGEHAASGEEARPAGSARDPAAAGGRGAIEGGAPGHPGRAATGVRRAPGAGPRSPRPEAAGGRARPAGRAAGTIDALVLPSAATTTFVNCYAPGGRRSQRVLAVASPLDPGRLPEAWRSADLLLLAPVLGEVDPAAFTAAVRARVVGLCVQGLVRTVLPDGSVAPRRLDPAAVARAGVSAAVLGEDEASAQPDLVGGLAAAVPIVAFTRGGRGCDVIVRGRTRHVGIHPAREIDPTGAGDVFAAAFLLALARGEDPVGAARLGAAAASVVVEGRGGEALPRIALAWERAPRVPVG